jgi:hypothetical protein
MSRKSHNYARDSTEMRFILKKLLEGIIIVEDEYNRTKDKSTHKKVNANLKLKYILSHFYHSLVTLDNCLGTIF